MLRRAVEAQAVTDVATLFAVFHVIQLVLIGLVALSVLLLADDLGRAKRSAVRRESWPGAWPHRLALGNCQQHR